MPRQLTELSSTGALTTHVALRQSTFFAACSLRPYYRIGRILNMVVGARLDTFFMGASGH
jgi:hypothetical protein